MGGHEKINIILFQTKQFHFLHPCGHGRFTNIGKEVKPHGRELPVMYVNFEIHISNDNLCSSM